MTLETALHEAYRLGVLVGGCICYLVGRYVMPEIEREARAFLANLRDERARILRDYGDDDRKAMLARAERQVRADAEIDARLRRQRYARFGITEDEVKP